MTFIPKIIFCLGVTAQWIWFIACFYCCFFFSFSFFASQAVEYFSKPDTAPLLVSVFWEKMNHCSSEVMVGAAEDPSVPGSPLLSPLSADSF